MLKSLAAAAILLTLTISAQARSTTAKPDLANEFCGSYYCGHTTYTPIYSPRAPRKPVEGRCSHHGCQEASIVSKPPGCPSRAYCGCSVSVKVFGHPVRDLYLASNWFKFPHAAPAPGMVAVRNHHVFYIEKVLDGNNVLAYDPNSGGHLTRLHVRSLAGFSVRNPNGGRYAGL